MSARLSLLLAFLLWASVAAAQAVPGTLSLQGYLKNSGGVGINDTVNLTVRIYTQASGGSVAYTEVHAGVTVANGRFKVQLGSVTPLPQAIITGNRELWVSLQVNNGAEMPRRTLTSAPYAISAERAAAATLADAASSLNCIGCVDGAKVSTGAINLSKLDSEVSTAFIDASGDTMTGKLTAPAGVDLSTAQIENMRFHNASSEPVTCTEAIRGYVYFNTADQSLRICNGSAFFAVGANSDTAPDEDDDGVPNTLDNCLLISNPDQTDTDTDGKGNACDPDDDGDGAADNADNCPLTANADQADTDSDSLGDACDPDDDGDGVNDNVDNCPLHVNADQADLDGDDQGDVCDPDDDGDGTADGLDNCPRAANASQTDTDGDGDGDACDTDDDGDGDLDVVDNCPLIANPDQADFEGDGLGDVCDPDDDGDGSVDGSDCAPRNAAISPNATESCNNVDDDCDGQTDEQNATGCTTYYYDADGDGYGSGANNNRCYCNPSSPYIAVLDTDCNDSNGDVSPGGTESCNTVDDDCDGQTDEGGVCAALLTPTIASSSPSSPANTIYATLSGTGSPSVTMRLYLSSTCSGNPVASGATDSNGDWTIAIVGATNGTRTFYAKSVDGADFSDCSSGFAFTHDSVKPNTVSLSGSTPTSPSDNNQPIIHGTAEANATIKIYNGVDCGGSVLASGTADGDGAFNIQVTVSNNTANPLRATATDGAGNVSNCSSALVFVHDTTPPGAPKLEGTTPCSPAPSTTPTLFGTGEASGTVKIYTNSSCTGAPVATTSSDSSGYFQQQMSLGVNTSQTWYAQVTDAVGNVGPCSSGLTYESRTCDQTPPGYNKVWVGAIDTNWAEAGNWSPSGAPGSGDNVFICGDAANQPRLLAAATVNNLYAEGASVDTNGQTLTVRGNLVGNGLGGTGTISMTEGSSTLQGCGMSNVSISSTVTLVGRTTTASGRSFTINDGATLLLAGKTLDVGGSFSTRRTNSGSSGLRMLNSNDEVIVRGNTAFYTSYQNWSANTSGAFAAGTMRMRGAVRQYRDGSRTEYSLVGTGTQFILDSGGDQTVTVDSMATNKSRFRHLRIENGTNATFTGATDVVMSGNFEVIEGSSVVATRGITVQGTTLIDGSTVSTASQSNFSGAMTVTGTGARLDFGPTAYAYSDFTVSDGATVTGTNLYMVSRLPVITGSTFQVQTTRASGNITMSRDITLPSTTNFNHPGSGWILNLNGHTLDIGGSLGNTKSNSSSDGIRMVNAADRLIVRGNATFYTAYQNWSANSSGNFTAGEMHFHGNFRQYRDGSRTEHAFVSTGTKAIFKGGGTQTITMDTPATNKSRFHSVQVTNGTTVNVTASMIMTGNLEVDPGSSLTAPSSLYVGGATTVNGGALESTVSGTFNGAVHITGAGSFDLGLNSTFNGAFNVDSDATVEGTNAYINTVLPIIDVENSTYTVTTTRVDGNLTMTRNHAFPAGVTLYVLGPGRLVVNGNTLTVGGHLRSDVSNTALDGLVMTNDNDVVDVGGNAFFATNYQNWSANSSGSYTKGLMTVGGHFTQYRDGSRTEYSFVSTGTKVHFDGTEPQTIRFDSAATNKSRFHGVEMTNTAGITTNDLFVGTGPLTINNATVMNVTDGSNTWFAGNLTITGGRLTTTGTTTIGGTADITAGGRLDLTGDGTVGGLLTINGASTMTGSNCYYNTRLPEISGATYTVTNTRVNGIYSLPHDILLPATTALITYAPGRLDVNGKTLTVLGNFANSVSNTSGTGLRMTNAADVVIVGGNATFYTAYQNWSANSSGNFTQGELRVGGNFRQYYDGSRTAYSFVSTGTRVVMNGGDTQNITFDTTGPSTSRFHHLTVTNSSVVSGTGQLWGTGDLVINGGASLSVSDDIDFNGDLTMDNGTLSVIDDSDFAGDALFQNNAVATFNDQVIFRGRTQVLTGANVTGAGASYYSLLPEIIGATYTITTSYVRGLINMTADITLPSTTTLYVDGARLSVGANTLTVNGSLATVTSNTSGTGLALTSPSSVVDVAGNATFYTSYQNWSASTSGNFSAGTLRVGGTFRQYRDGSRSAYSFVSTGTKVVLDGGSAQNVQFDSPNDSRFASVDVTNTAGATFLTSTRIFGGLDISGKLTNNSGRTSTVTGTMTLRTGSTLTNSGAMSVGGCVKESGHTLTGTDPCP